MAKTRAKSDMDTQSFLLNAASMQVSELEGLARELDAIIVRKKTTGIDKRESQLIQLINQTALNSDQRARYSELAEKLALEKISEAEHTEFMALVELDEQLRNDRVKYLIELSHLRNISLPQLMSDLGLDPVAYG